MELKLCEANYGLEDWQNTYVDIETGLKDKDGNALTGGYTGLTEDTTYTVSAAVDPKPQGRAPPKVVMQPPSGPARQKGRSTSSSLS